MKISSARHLRRHANLGILVSEAGGTTAIALRAATPKSHISAMLAGNRGVGDTLAAKLERVMERPPGWMDVDHALAATGTTTSTGSAMLTPGTSLPAKPDAALRAAFGQIAEQMRGADPTEREMVALLMRDIAVRPEALDSTLAMLFRIVGLPPPGAASTAPAARPLGPGADRMLASVEAIVADLPVTEDHPGVTALPERGESTSERVGRPLLGKIEHRSDKKHQKGSK